jgi:integrase/recombinase XerD
MGRPRSKVTKVCVVGPLAPYVAAVRSRLAEHGYTPLTSVNELRQVAHLSRWMAAGQLTVAELTPERLDQFLAVRAAGGHGACSRQGLTPLLEVLGGAGMLGEERPRAPGSASDRLLAWFHRYLLQERGLAAGTAEAYLGRAHGFLEGCGGAGELACLTAADVTRAVERECARVSAGSVQYFVAALRSFLRFCFAEGLTPSDLSAAALAVTGRRSSSLPRGISHADAMALLASCNRRRSDGRRDYAVLLTLLRLGLRAGEVAGLRLEDIDWRAGEIVVRGKGRREDRLPLPADAGEAIAGYLQRGRPAAAGREVFTRAVAPAGPLGRGGVSSIVRRACRRAGIAVVGAHRLRHTLACEMVAAQVPLPEIGQVLRHRGLTSTAAYARVDVEALRELALPWPGGEPR